MECVYEYFMKPKLKLHILFLVLLGLPALASAQGTAFSYQGHLLENGAAANGGHDFIFTLFYTAVGDGQIGPPVPLNNIPVASGQFNVTLDYRANVFTGDPRWLEISVRPAGVGQFTKMDARVALLPTPYAIFAATAGSVANGAVAANQLKTGGLAPAPGQVLSYKGGNLFWIDPGVAAGGIWSVLNHDAYYTAGNVGIGGLAGTSRLQIAGADALTLAGAGPYLTWRDTTTGRNAAISSAGGTLYYRVPNALGNVLTAGYVDSNGMVTRGRLSVEGSVIVTETVNATHGIGIGNNPGTIDAPIYSDSAVSTRVVLYNTASSSLMDLTCRNGDVGTLTIRGGADLAEPFELSKNDIAKGSVMIIDSENEGKLKLSEQSYDRRVAGVVSGANGVNPGISLHQEGVLEGGQNVALSGRVYVLADAATGVIKPGDLLTTSDTPGHAMKVANYSKAQGAILGKAMSGLREGKGLVLVLVTLQ
jgi:hypothetical protein